MQTCFEHFAATSMLGCEDAPPRRNGALCFARPWERRAFGLALALAKEGHFEWEDFRQALIASIATWERAHAEGDGSWDYYQLWLEALLEVVGRAGLLDGSTLQALTDALLAQPDADAGVDAHAAG
jgi:nitrile hydratase accessory protein